MLLTIVTMSEYDPTIWDDLTTPSVVNKQDLINKICFDCGELELLYGDPNLLKIMIANWSRTEGYVWNKLAATLNLNYNPIYNLDVTYEETRTPNLTKTRTPDLAETRTPNLTEKRTPNITETQTPNTTRTETPNTTRTETPTDTTTESVAGYNEDVFHDSRKTTRGGTITIGETGTITIGESGTNTTTHTGTETISETGIETKRESGTETSRETGTETVVTRRYGNQGVTMTQDMLAKEREISLFNLYEYISNSFKNRFCLMVY